MIPVQTVMKSYKYSGFFEINIDNSVLQKFINETYHIENEYICQLDQTQFDLIPEYVTLACDKCLETA
jgi:hypothetical protein